MLWRILSFNVGVELGQIAALVVMVSLLAVWRRRASFKRFSYAELAAREKLDLNLSWLREEGATDPASLPPPAEIAASIAEDLETALARFRAVAARLG